MKTSNSNDYKDKNVTDNEDVRVVKLCLIEPARRKKMTLSEAIKILEKTRNHVKEEVAKAVNGECFYYVNGKGFCTAEFIIEFARSLKEDNQ